MQDANWLAERFETHRSHLRSVAYRMLGSATEADDAVQEAWLKVSRADAGGVDNLGGWLTTIVARVCLDMLRTRKSRREEPLEPVAGASAPPREFADRSPDPEREAAMADSVGLALLVVLDTLEPAERLAFVMHDMFAVPFEEIGPIVGRAPAAARQLASRARRRVRGAANATEADLKQQREVVDAFLTALRAGDFEGLLRVLDPDVLVQLDAGGAAPGQPTEVRGARNWAQGAVAFSRLARSVQMALVNGSVGLIVAPRGKLFRALNFTITDGKISRVEVIADPNRLRTLEVGVLPPSA